MTHGIIYEVGKTIEEGIIIPTEGLLVLGKSVTDSPYLNASHFNEGQIWGIGHELLVTGFEAAKTQPAWEHTIKPGIDVEVGLGDKSYIIRHKKENE